MTDTGIDVIGVARSFGAVHAVRDATFSAPAGAVTALIGPNGSGKTTLMLMLASLLTPDSGSIRIAGQDPVADPRAVRAAMGWMPDVLGSWATLSVRATLEITGRLHGLSKPASAARAEELIDLVGLEPLAQQPTRVLSRGQKQKLSLARSLVHDPRVLLLDEPASGLDPSARAELRILVRRLADEGRCLLVSSHVLSELDEMADSAVYIEAGASVSAERIGRAKASLRQWRVRALDASAVPAAVEAAGVERDRIGRDHLGTLVSVESEAEAASVLTKLVGAGLAISSFAPVVGDLEHTYLDLSRGAVPAQPVIDGTEDLS
ncbi:ABC transporter ATP-binding protein [Amnibacterium flavum]|uniref:Multidrug ABC transporter ATP-binding protein n=1 Tax=Amnibacterium flavum TaxID=2173173 RepID=A0A2V1HMP4_9MICO|nr:ABC transporter ATP-binding protein [Amnibacterium flavum]PVZ93691.1 multidrug ABC transporter ATP-binding protein [Amnibacterium flavum]